MQSNFLACSEESKQERCTERARERERVRARERASDREMESERKRETERKRARENERDEVREGGKTMVVVLTCMFELAESRQADRPQCNNSTLNNYRELRAVHAIRPVTCFFLTTTHFFCLPKSVLHLCKKKKS